MKPDIPKTILGCPVFKRVDQESLDELCTIARVRSYEKGQTIFNEGDEPPGLFIVVSGQVRVYKIAPSGKEHVLHLSGVGSTFAEVAVLGDFPCPAYAEAVEQTICVLLPASRLQQLLKANHGLCLQIMAGMGQWVRHLVNLLEDIVLRDAMGRVARYLLDTSNQQGSSVINLPSLKKHLASHLNLTSETLSRTLRRLADLGLIEADNSQELVIVDIQLLGDTAAGLYPQV